MADLLKGEMVLTDGNEFSGIRNLGRTNLELWLNANELLLDPEAAWDRVVKEDAKSQSQLQDDFAKIWDRYEAIRQDGIDLRDPAFEREESLLNY
jgi:hypothetical protein